MVIIGSSRKALARSPILSPQSFLIHYPELNIRLDYDFNTPAFTEAQCHALYSTLHVLPEKMRRTVYLISKENLREGNPAYSTSYGKIVMSSRPIPLRNWTMSFLHELGHLIDFRFLPIEQARHWQELSTLSGSEPDHFVSGYAQVGEIREDFAKTFALYLIDTLGFLALAQEQAAIGKTILMEKFKFMVAIFSLKLDAFYTRVFRLQFKSDESESRLIMQRRMVPIPDQGVPALENSLSSINF